MMKILTDSTLAGAETIGGDPKVHSFGAVKLDQIEQPVRASLSALTQ